MTLKKGVVVPAPTLVRDIEQAATILESQIKAIAEAGRAIERSTIGKGALVRLIAHESGVSMTDVRTILDVLPDLDKRLLKWMGGRSRVEGFRLTVEVAKTVREHHRSPNFSPLDRRTHRGHDDLLLYCERGHETRRCPADFTPTRFHCWECETGAVPTPMPGLSDPPRSARRQDQAARPDVVFGECQRSDRG